MQNLKFKFKILAALLFIIFSCAAAQAEISAEVVERAWERVAQAANFKVVKINYEKNKAPNAWVKFQSQDNFSVHVTQGLMKILNTEEEIAGVLGHEIGHVRCGHYDSGMNRKLGWAALGALLQISKAGRAVVAASSLGANLAESGFSRGQEVEADDYGTDLLFKAGYDHWGLYHAMKSFKDNKIITQPNGFNSHPPTERRLKHLADRAKFIDKSNTLPQDSKFNKSSKKSKNNKNKLSTSNKTGFKSYHK